MANADGSIIFSTEIDNKKAQAELDKLEKKIASLEIKASQTGAKKIPLEEQANALGAALDDAKQKLEALKASGASRGAIGAQSETVTSLQYQWDQVNNKIDRYNREIEKANGLQEQGGRTRRATRFGWTQYRENERWCQKGGKKRENFRQPNEICRSLCACVYSCYAGAFKVPELGW